MPIFDDKFIEEVQNRANLVLELVEKLLKKELYVGVPAENNGRDAGAIGNAALAYIHDNGSPRSGIPQREFLRPGIEAAKADAVESLKRAARAALLGSPDKADAHFNQAGMIVADAIKTKIRDGVPPPIKPETALNRHRQRGTKIHPSEIAYAELAYSGASAKALMAAGGITPLVNTSQLLASITYVVKG